jgi:sulfoxide reductase catalytic subunit YedY
MHELTILATGLYGEAASAAERRAVAPGCAVEVWLQVHQVHRAHRSGRGDAEVVLDDHGGGEYGFYANVNPDSAAPALVAGHRAAHRRELGGDRRCSFNGYAEEVAHLYPDLDSREWYY